MLELCIALLLLLIPSHLFFRLRFIPLVHELLPALVAFLLFYIPLFFLKKTKTHVSFFDPTLKKFFSSVLLFLLVSVLVFPLFGILAHFWMKIFYHVSSFHFAAFTAEMWQLALFQVVVIALPEEFFFRGYLQERMNLLFPSKPWKIFGVHLGKSWLLTAFVFALAHSLIVVQWWHFSIFFPALLFGYLREKTGSITAAVFFHAACNVFMVWFMSCYS